MTFIIADVYCDFLSNLCLFYFVSLSLILYMCIFFFFFFKQKTAYEMRISDWSSDVCSSDLPSGDLTVEEGGKVLPLSRVGREGWGAHLTPAGPRAFLFFRGPLGAVSEVVEGDATFVRAGTAPAPGAPPSYRPLVGRYSAHGEEGPSVRIYARGAQLMMSYADSSPPIPPVEIGRASCRER